MQPKNLLTGPQLIPRRVLRSSRPHHPAVLDEARTRSEDFQLRLADRITTFAGSMSFVYLHALLFAVWMLVLEKSPWPTLTLVVSLEAIFLSAFVMIGQNRQAAFQQAKADHDFEAEELELKTNTDITRQIHALTEEVHRRVTGSTGSTPQTYPAPRRDGRGTQITTAPGTAAMSASDEVIAQVRDALWAEFTRQAQVDTLSAPTVSRKHDYIEGEVDMDAAAEAVLRVFGDVKNEDGYTNDVDG
jgi:uncharacterized membrane protein